LEFGNDKEKTETTLDVSSTY